MLYAQTETQKNKGVPFYCAFCLAFYLALLDHASGAPIKLFAWFFPFCGDLLGKVMIYMDVPFLTAFLFLL